ncbi:MAG: ABC transporter permease [Gammaproteobacteria bacterium]|nr:MAG: ABC transporter permease [Gammaproteobacteria bacterium]
MTTAPETTPARKGAEESRQSALEAWLAHHRDSARQSLADQLGHPVASLLSWLAMAVALALPALLALGLMNLGALTHTLDASRQATLYFSSPPEDATVLQLKASLVALPEVAKVEYLSPDAALDTFRAINEAADLLAGLDANPLPASLQVTLKADTPLERLDVLKTQWSALPGIESVQLDTVWLERLQALETVLQRAWGLLAILLGLAALLFIGNTVRLAIENRRDEILVSRLVGATDAWVRRPFLYMGAWYGLIGAVLAAVLVHLCMAMVAGPVEALSALYFSAFRLEWPGLSGTLILLLAGSALGWLGAWLTVLRELQKVEPR